MQQVVPIGNDLGELVRTLDYVGLTTANVKFFKLCFHLFYWICEYSHKQNKWMSLTQ